jgi:hypothetical protein
MQRLYGLARRSARQATNLLDYILAEIPPLYLREIPPVRDPKG